MKNFQIIVAGLILLTSVVQSRAKAGDQKVVSAKAQKSVLKLPEPDGTFTAMLPLRMSLVGDKTTFLSSDGTALSLNKKTKNLILYGEGDVGIRPSNLTISRGAGNTTVVTGKGRIKVQWNIKK